MSQPSNRFLQNHTEARVEDDSFFADDEKEEQTLPRTQVFKDSSKTILTKNNSPDVGFEYSVNPYRGCEHGCAYCYARPTHEYLGYSAGLDFETKILVKEDAPELLREALMSPRWQPKTIAMSGVTDCYQPLERKFQLTRRCLQVLAEFKNPVSLITKNQLILRDLEILAQMAQDNLALVFISITTLDDELCGKLEPRTSRPQARLRAIEKLAQAGIPVGVNVAPTIPGLTDHEMPDILKAARAAGAEFAGYVPLRLPSTTLQIFTEWLAEHRPDRKEKVLSAIREVRGGKLNDSNFGSRMKGQGVFADNIAQMFKLITRREGLNQKTFELSTEHFRRPSDQMSFF